MALPYPELITAIQGYSRDTSAELLAAMPVILDQAYTRLGRAFSILRQFRKQLTGTLPASSSIFTLPSDCIYIRDFEVLGPDGTSSILEMREFDSLRAMYANVTKIGLPRFFAEYTSTALFLAPTPDQIYNFSLVYALRQPAITAASPSDWLSSNAEDALLMACLLEAALFKQDQSLISYYKPLYLEAKQAVLGEYVTTQRSDYRVNTTQTFNMASPELGLANGQQVGG